MTCLIAPLFAPWVALTGLASARSFATARTVASAVALAVARTCVSVLAAVCCALVSAAC